MFFNSQERKTSFGLLVMRLGLAAALLIHAAPKMFGGTPQWIKVGGTFNLAQFGIPPDILGFAALLVEMLGALSLLTGFLFRITCILMTILFGLYCFTYFNVGYRSLTFYALGLAAVFLGLSNTGAGRYAVAVKLEKK